jgi:hypothetical protein
MVRRARAGGPSADPPEQFLASLREHVLADVLASHSLEEVDDWLEGVDGLGREERAALWLNGWVSADRCAHQPGRHQGAFCLEPRPALRPPAGHAVHSGEDGAQSSGSW